jgi:sec-independent protein translocase protein TatA
MFENILQPTHLILVLVVAMIFFGPKKLPELGRSLGEGIRGFRDAMRQHHDDTKDENAGRLPVGSQDVVPEETTDRGSSPGEAPSHPI